MYPFKRILVPIDFSEDSERAMRLALDVGGGVDSTLVLGHVVETHLYASDLELMFPHPEQHAPVVARVEQALDALAERLITDGRAWRRRVVLGQPAARIVELADEEQVDLIVMGTLGATGLTQLLVGSTTERVVRTARCPVLSVRRRP